MADDFAGYAAALNAPGGNAAAVTPHDTNPLPNASRALWIGVAGNVAVKMVGGQTVTFVGVPIGWLDIRADVVLAAGTTATSIVAVW